MNNPGLGKPAFDRRNPLGKALSDLSGMTTRQITTTGGVRTAGFGDRLALISPKEKAPKIPDLYWCQYRTSSGTIPQYSVMEIYDYKSDLNVYYVRRPTGDSKSQVVFTGVVNEIEYDANFPTREMTLNWFHGGIPVKYNGTAPSVGDEVGTVANQWYVQKGKYGLLVLGVDTGRGLCFVRPFNPGLLHFNFTGILFSISSIEFPGGLDNGYSANFFAIPEYNPTSVRNCRDSTPYYDSTFNYPLNRNDYQFGSFKLLNSTYSDSAGDVLNLYTKNVYDYSAALPTTFYTQDWKGRAYYSLDDPPSASDVAIGAYRYMPVQYHRARTDGLSSVFAKITVDESVIQDSYTEDRSSLPEAQQNPNYLYYTTGAVAAYTHGDILGDYYGSSGVFVINRSVSPGEVWKFRSKAKSGFSKPEGFDRVAFGVRAFLLDLHDCGTNRWGKLVASSGEFIMPVQTADWPNGDTIDFELTFAVPEDYEG